MYDQALSAVYPIDNVVLQIDPTNLYLDIQKGPSDSLHALRMIVLSPLFSLYKSLVVDAIAHDQ